MYNDTNLIYILTILEAIEKIKIYSDGFETADDFFWANQQLNFNGTLNLLIAIGEESKKIDAKLKQEFPDMKWKEIAGMRDRLAHDYRGIDPNIVWSVIGSELEKLKEIAIKMLERIDFKQELLLEAINTRFFAHLSYLKNS